MKACRACGSDDELEQVLDLGSQYLPDFPDPGTPRGDAHPLRLLLCTCCGLLQLDGTVSRELLYHERYGFKSGVNEAVRADLADVVQYALKSANGPRTWLDIACNDGTLLSSVPDHIERGGIDPLAQFATEARTHADWIIPDFFRSEHLDPGSLDVVTSVSMFYDVDDLNEFVAGVARVLSQDGIWVIQQNYALDMLRLNAVDNVCHEHVTYFGVAPLWLLLARHGLEISDVTYSDVNGGCVRTLVSHRNRRAMRASVSTALEREREAKLDDPATWITWGANVRQELGWLRLMLDDLAADGRPAWLYGASTRGGTFLQMIGAGPEVLPFAADRNPAKVGKIMATTGIPIVSEEEMRKAAPSHLLCSPWFFRKVFLDRERAYLEAGGRFIFPLPRLEIAGSWT